MGCCASSALVHERVHAGSQQQAAATRHQYIDPSFLVQILQTKQVRLLRAEYILEWIDSGRGPLPCRQDFPEEGFVDVDALNEQQLASLVIIAVSYCWITKDHPDPNCYHLQTLGSLVRCFIKSSFSSAPDKITMSASGAWRTKADLQRSGANFGAGDGHCVGIFLDWTGLYQDKPEGRRTSEENEVFKQALKTINIWYAHVTTIVWMLTSLPAGVQRKGYQDSGWTAFEASVASILTKGTDMLDITDAARNTLLTSDSCRLDNIQLSHDLMSRQSRVLALPDEFDSMIDGKVFTNGADKETVVKPKYAKTFHDLIPSSPAIQYSGLGLTPDNVYKILDLATMHIKNLETLDLSCNQGIDLPIQSFAHLPSLTTLILGVTKVSGDVGALKPLVNLKYLNLSDTQVTGDVAELQAFVDLTHLELPEQVTGDVGALQALVDFTVLSLGGTQVGGDVGKLQSLVKLKSLGLGGTQVTGDVGALQALVNLAVLGLGDTQVTGNVGELHALVDLIELDVGGTQVTGDVGKLQALVNLERLNLAGTQVCGNVGGLQPLVKLAVFDVGQTQVTGDVGALQALVNLEHLNLASTQVCGNVGGLQPLVKLARFDLGGTQVTGVVGALQALVNLAVLGLGDTQVTGNVGELHALVDLIELDVGGTQVTGDVSMLQMLVKLTEFNLSGSSHVGGDVGELRALVHLAKLRLCGTQVTGDVSELRVLVNLKELGLSHTQVTGDIGELWTLFDLTELDLEETKVTGNVVELQALVNLTQLYLRGTQACGDVGPLQARVNLKRLDVGETSVTGDAIEFQEPTEGARVTIRGKCWNTMTEITMTQLGSDEVRGHGRNRHGRFTVIGAGKLEQSMDLIITNQHGDWKVHLSADMETGGYHGSWLLQNVWHSCAFEKSEDLVDTSVLNVDSTQVTSGDDVPSEQGLE